jgi:hypothetical protein
MPGIVQVNQQGKGYIISVNNNANKIIQAIGELSPLSMDIINESLEDIFEEYVGRDHHE